MRFKFERLNCGVKTLTLLVTMALKSIMYLFRIAESIAQ